MRQIKWIMIVFILSLLAVVWAVPAATGPCTPKFGVSLNFIGGLPPGASKQWPILIDGRQVGVTNNQGILMVTPSVGSHLFSTGMSWTFNKKNYRYSGQIQKSIACNTWQLLIPVSQH